MDDCNSSISSLEKHKKLVDEMKKGNHIDFQNTAAVLLNRIGSIKAEDLQSTEMTSQMGKEAIECLRRFGDGRGVVYSGLEALWAGGPQRNSTGRASVVGDYTSLPSEE